MSAVPADIVKAAQASQRTWNILSSIVIAQWALESAWGRSIPNGSNNPFGMKSLPGQPHVVVETHEVYKGQTVEVMAAFRKFASLTEAFDAHGKLLATGSAYASARRVRDNAKAFAHALTGHYATDLNYGDKLIDVMNGADLYRFDTPSI